MYELSVGDSLFQYEDAATRQVLRRAADAHANKDARRSVRFKAVSSTKDISEALEETRRFINDAAFEVIEHDDQYQINLKRTIHRKDIEGGKRSIEGSFGIFEITGTNIWMAITGAEPDFYKRGLLWLLKQGEPTVSDVYINSSELEAILDEVKSSLSRKPEIRVKKAVAYTRKEEGTISFEKNPYKEVFRVSEQNDKYIDKIRFVVHKEDDELFTASIGRNGEIQFDSGDVGLFFNHLLTRYAEIGEQKTDVLSDKERSKETGDVDQLKIKFGQDVFYSPDDNSDLIEALSNLSRSSVTVYHRNPYAHLSVLDFVDGSSCDVFVTAPDEISIVPSYRESVNSLMRISEQISREFDEGTVTETQEPEYEAADFFS